MSKHNNLHNGTSQKTQFWRAVPNEQQEQNTGKMFTRR